MRLDKLTNQSKDQETSSDNLLATSEYDIVTKKLLHDQLLILNKNLLLSLIISTVLSSFVLFKLYYILPHSLIFGWFIAVIIVSIFRLGIYIYFHKVTHHDQMHLQLFILGCILSAILWSMVGTVLMPENDIMSQMINIIVIAGVTAGAVQTLQATLVGSSLYINIILAPLCIWLFMHGSDYYILAASMLLYLSYMMFAILRLNTLYLQTLRLGYNNLNLLDELKTSNKTLISTIESLRLHEREMSLINKLNEMLQSCQDTSEAYLVIDKIASQLFHGDINVGLAIYNKDTKNLELVLQRGEDPNLNAIFDPNDCWALRQGHIYLNNEPDTGLVCKHFKSNPSGGFICIPLIARNKIIGLLSQNANKNSKINKNHSDIAIMFSEVIKLSIANIQLHQSLVEQSIHDPLTGLFNRRYLDTILVRELQRLAREKNKLCISMIDIDFFKRFNDEYGHEAGDEVLKMIGKTFLKEFRETDIPCRFGGEEFIIILLNTDLNNAIAKLQEVHKKISAMRLYFKGNELPSVTVSMGVAVAPDHGKTFDEIITSVDIALYAAKNNGRNRIEIYQPTKS